MKTYEGLRQPGSIDAAGECVVFVDGQVLPIAPSLALENHSSSGFNWGYAGAGPKQLALALLLDALGDPERARRIYRQFTVFVVSTWPQTSNWKITEDEIRQVCQIL